MSDVGVVYNSAESKTEDLARSYVGTHQAPHRYLAYRDVPQFINQFVKGKKSLDYGAGTGASSFFLYNLGLDVVGVDISSGMLAEARSNFPSIKFYDSSIFCGVSDFDLVFSSFVLFEIPSKEGIIQYLRNACSFLNENGVFIGITGSQHLYSVFRHWLTFDANFPENANLHSGNIARLVLKYPKIEFYDYYWEESDYLDCFKKSGLEILKIHSPLGMLEDPWSWRDELAYSPFTIFIARKTKIREI